MTERYGDENSWNFGNCNSSRVYNSFDSHIEECCQPQGTYELACTAAGGYGWDGGYIEIGENKYCENFKSGSEENHNVTMGKVKLTDICSSKN